MEFSFEQPRPRPEAAGAMNTGSTDQAVGSDRLRKAIERNRAKQAKRAETTSRVTGQPMGGPEVMDSSWSLPKSKPTPSMASSMPNSSASSTSSSTRRSVGKAGEQEFMGELRKRTPRAPSPVSYEATTAVAKTTTAAVPARTRKKLTTVKALGSKGKTKRVKGALGSTNEYIIKGVWVFCALLFVRLIFSNGGVMDYYDKKEVLDERFQEQARIEEENVALLKEIDLLKKNATYQKKVVREHLGYIASDEFLILFPES